MLDNIDRKLFPFRKGSHMLDIGSAKGDNSLVLKESGCKVSALEIDPNLVEIFKQRPEAKDIDIRLADARDMPFKDNSFDGAILIEVIEHVPGTEKLLSEIHRVLKPGGKLCIGVPTGYTEKIYWKLHPDYASNATHFTIFSKSQLTKLINDAGLRVIAIRTKNLEPAVAWMFHATLRSKSDHTGAIHEHLWVERMLGPIFAVWSKIPILNKGLGFISRYYGKSWYIYVEKPA